MGKSDIKFIGISFIDKTGKERLELPNAEVKVIVEQYLNDKYKFQYDCTKCVNGFMNPFDQYYCWKDYDIDKNEDCEGIYFKMRKK
jgi:hypothetical protein